MEFFNKYKDLFGVPEGLGLPSARLKLDNDLFIQKTYVPTKTQQYSLNGKLRQLKKDYQDFENQMNELTKLRQTPKRSLSRKGNDSTVKAVTLNEKYNQNRSIKMLTEGVPKRPHSNKQTLLQQQKQTSDMLKRDQWLMDEQNNILKHSELDHIFSNRLNKVYDLDEIKETTLPKPEEVNLGYSLDTKRSKLNNQFTIKQRSKQNLANKGDVPNNRSANLDNARSRRQTAKNNLQFRRKKLQSLLRTLW